MPRFESGLSRKSGMVHEGRDDRAKGVGKSQVNTCWDKVTTGDRLHVDDWQSYLSTQPSHTLPFGAVVLTQPCLVNAMTYRQSIDSVVSYGSLQRIHEVDGVRTKLSLGLNRGLDRINGHPLLRLPCRSLQWITADSQQGGPLSLPGSESPS